MFKLENLKNELIGKEFSILEFDNIMINNNFYEEYENYTSELLESEYVNYTYKTNEMIEDLSILINFQVTCKNSDDESVAASYIKITDISNN